MRALGSRGSRLSGKLLGHRNTNVFQFAIDRCGSREAGEILGTKNLADLVGVWAAYDARARIP